MDEKAQEYLARCRNPDSVQREAATAEVRRDALSAEEPETRCAALQALFLAEGGAAAGLLARAFAEVRQPTRVRLTALACLTLLGEAGKEVLRQVDLADGWAREVLDEPEPWRAAPPGTPLERLPSLTAALSDPNADQRFWAGNRLAESGPVARHPLRAALICPEPRTKMAAAKALLKLAPDHVAAVRAALAGLAPGDPVVRRDAVRALGLATAQPERAWAGLLPALEDEDDEVSALAAHALDSDAMRPPATLAVPRLAAALPRLRNWEQVHTLSLLLASYKAEAEPALDALLQLLRDFRDDVGQDFERLDTYSYMTAENVCWTLAYIGGAAAAALPLLEELLPKAEEADGSPGDEDDEESSLSCAIRDAIWFIKHPDISLGD